MSRTRRSVVALLVTFCLAASGAMVTSSAAGSVNAGGLYCCK
jgi:hypothetical protein